MKKLNIFSSLSMVMCRVFTITTKQLKIFNSIIFNIAVNMVDNFFGLKIPAKMLFHNISMFFNIPIFFCKRMVRHENINIFTNTTNFFTSFPSRIIVALSLLTKTAFSFFRMLKPNISSMPFFKKCFRTFSSCFFRHFSFWLPNFKKITTSARAKFLSSFCVRIIFKNIATIFTCHLKFCHNTLLRVGNLLHNNYTMHGLLSSSKKIAIFLIIVLPMVMNINAGHCAKVTSLHTWVSGETPTAALWNGNDNAFTTAIDNVETEQIVDATIVNADIAASTIDLTAKVTGTLPVANGGTGTTNSTLPSFYIDLPDGTVAIPSLTFADDLDTGLYSPSANDVGFASAGVLRGGFNGNGMYVSTVMLAADGSAASPVYSFSDDTNTGMYWGSADNINYATGGALRFAMSNSQITSYVDFVTSAPAGSNLGNATDYWNDVSYKTLTDRGCLGWFDEGVEMPNGDIVSDAESIKLLKKHPTKKTIYGKEMMDYKSFPKVAYKKATKKVLNEATGEYEEVEFARDENDEPYYIDDKGNKKFAADGIEMTSMFSIMIGSIKELTLRVETLEQENINLKARVTALESQ